MAIMQYKPNRVEDAINAMDRTVFKIAHKFKRNHAQDVDDLIQAGRLGVVQAYDRYDQNAGSAFSSYAYQYIWVHIKEYSVKNWNTYNHTSGVSFEDHKDLEADQSDERMLDFKLKYNRMNNTQKAIVRARNEGYTFAEISNAMETLGKSMTLHKVRNIYMDAIAE